MRNETGAADGIAADPVADTHQLIDRRGNIEDRDRLVVNRMFAGMKPQDPLRMMARTLDGIDRIKHVKKIKGLVAPGHSGDLPVTLEPIVYLTAEMDIGAGKACSKHSGRSKHQLFEDGKRLLGRGAIGEPETILMGHHRLDHAA